MGIDRRDLVFRQRLRLQAVPAQVAVVSDAQVPETEGGALTLNAMIDEGESVGVSETLQHIHDGTLFDWLGEACHGGLGPTLLGPGDFAVIVERFRFLNAAMDVSRVYGVERNGLSLLLAFCLASLNETQSGQGARDVRPAG